MIVSVAKKFIHNHFKKEISVVEENTKQGRHLIVKELEKELKIFIDVNNIPVLVKGVCDRVDSMGQMLRIIDYKTGAAGLKELQINGWEEIYTNPELNKGFQLLMYALLYMENTPDMPHEFISGIISFRELSAGLKAVKVNGSELLTKEVLVHFKNELSKLLSTLYDTQAPFKQTNNEETCTYCPYKSICNR